MSIRVRRRATRAVLAIALSSLVGCSSSQTSGADEASAGSPAGGAASSAGTGQSGAPQGLAGALVTAGSGGAGNDGSAGTGAVAGGAGGTAAAMAGMNATGGESSSAGAGGRAAGNGGNAGSAPAGGGASGVQPKITIWIAGDSTVATGGPCPIGWGGKFKALFNDKVTVTNSAVAGRSVRTWLYNPASTLDSTGECVLPTDGSGNPTVQAHWTAMLNGMKSGDYLFIQFGINDSDAACPRHVGVSAFKASYGVMAAAAKARGAQPIFVTPTSNIACNGSKVSTSTREPFVTATKDAGTQYGVPVVDLNVLSTTLYSSLGFCPIPGGGDVSATTTGAVGAFFCEDHTHFDTTGAVQIAGLVAKALTDQGIALSAYLQ